MKLRSKEGRSPGDLTRQFSQVIQAANKLTGDAESKDAKRTVVGLPDCASATKTIPNVKEKRGKAKGVQIQNRIRELKPTESWAIAHGWNPH